MMINTISIIFSSMFYLYSFLLIMCYFSSVAATSNLDETRELTSSSSLVPKFCRFNCDYIENSDEQDSHTTAPKIKRLNQGESSFARNSESPQYGSRNYQDNIYEYLTEEENSRLQKVYYNVVDSVVSIITPSGSHGSGFVIDKKGHILTNYHVAGEESKVLVRLFNNNEYNAIVIGKDKYSDSSVLQIDPRAINFNNLEPLLFAKSSSGT